MSSGSESDEEYVPVEPEQVSEEDSADEETDQQYSKELEYKTKKRKAVEDSKTKKKRKSANDIDEPVKDDPELNDKQQTLDPVEEKKREDDLWAMFLEGTDTKPKSVAARESNDSSKKIDAQKPIIDKTEQKVKQKSEDEKEKERRIFEFAGETIVVENNVIKEKIKTANASGSVKKIQAPSSRSGGGLSNVLGLINKKNKLSTLEKSKLDWETYKHEEGIADEIQQNNKGKGGYLDRKDFLERADLRQYEIERDLRMSRRSKR